MAGRDRLGFVGMHGAACLQVQATTSNGTAEAKATQRTKQRHADGNQRACNRFRVIVKRDQGDYKKNNYMAPFTYFINHIFSISHNKSANNTFSDDFLNK
jgi:hypothetical protein